MAVRRDHPWRAYFAQADARKLARREYEKLAGAAAGACEPEWPDDGGYWPTIERYEQTYAALQWSESE